MKLFDQLAIEEIENIAAEGELDAETRIANTAELVALRRLHMIAAREHRGTIKFIRIIDSLPGVGDVAAWKRIVAESRAAAAAENGATPDLVSITRKS